MLLLDIDAAVVKVVVDDEVEVNDRCFTEKGIEAWQVKLGVEYSLELMCSCL